MSRSENAAIPGPKGGTVRQAQGRLWGTQFCALGTWATLLRNAGEAQASGREEGLDFSSDSAADRRAAFESGKAARRQAQGCGERPSRSAGARLAAFQRRRAPDPHQRYFDQPDGGGKADWGGEIGESRVPITRELHVQQIFQHLVLGVTIYGRTSKCESGIYTRFAF